MIFVLVAIYSEHPNNLVTLKLCQNQSNSSCAILSYTSFFIPPKNVHLRALLYVKNQPNFFQKKNSSKNINLGEHFLLNTFFSRLNFWTTLLSKIRPNFCRPHTMSIHKILQFHLTTVDFWVKTLHFRTHQARNSLA